MDLLKALATSKTAITATLLVTAYFGIDHWASDGPLWPALVLGAAFVAAVAGRAVRQYREPSGDSA